MKKFISVMLIISLFLSIVSISASAYSWDDPKIMTVDEAIEKHTALMGEEVATNRYYFLMPNGSNGKKGDESRLYAESWYKTYFDGTPATDTACIYWWDSGVADPEGWVGYLPSGRDENDSDVFYADVPQAATSLHWNNGIDGGMDSDQEIYYCAAQTCIIPCEYYDPDESPLYPDGTESFDNMIYVIDPDRCSTSEWSEKVSAEGEWYYYYGNGCYGTTENGDENDCLRDDHNHNDETPSEAPTEEPIIEPTEAPYYPTEAPYPTESVETETGVLHFDVNSAGWKNYKKIHCYIWEYGTSNKLTNWQEKKNQCRDNGDGTWTFDLESKGLSLKKGVQYCAIFSADTGVQTYDLLLDTTCFGDEAYCNGDVYENPTDSNKTSQVAVWRGQDPTVLGPVKCITSIGNVVGTCMPSSVTPFGLFTNFLTEALLNAREYSGKTDQKLLDDTAYALGLTREDVEGAIRITGVDVEWLIYRSYLEFEDYDADITPDIPPASPDQPDLPNYPMEYGNTLRFDVNSADWYNYKQIYCHIWEYGGESFYAWSSKAEKCTDYDNDGIWTYDLDAKGITLDRNKQYCVIFFADTGMQTYDLLFDYTVLGDVACCADEIRYEAPSDSNKTCQAAFWCNQDCDEFGPVMCITSVGNVVGTCVPESTTTFLMLVDFFNNILYNARMYSGKTDQQLVDDLADALGLNDSLVKQAISLSGETVYWSADGEAPVVPPTEAPTEPTIPSLPQLPDDADISKIFIDFGRFDVAEVYMESGMDNSILGERLYDNVWEFDFSDYYHDSNFWMTCEFTDGMFEWRNFEINDSYYGYTYVMNPFEGGNQIEPAPGYEHLVYWQYIDHYSKLVHGDVDLDGEVTIMDATEVQILVARVRDYSCKFAQIASDVDGDGEMSIMDSTEVQLMVAGLK